VGAHRDRGKDLRRTLKEQAAGVAGEERPDPGNQVVINPFTLEVEAEDSGIKPSFDVNKE